jgi:hypothetical protein
MRQKTKKFAYTALLVLIGILTIRVFYSVYSQITMEGQPTLVDGAVRDRGRYIDVLLTIQNNKNVDTVYRWEINFFGDQKVISSFSDRVKAGSSLMHATSYAAPKDKGMYYLNKSST